MANFVVIVDPDNERRINFVEGIKRIIAPVDGLITDSCGVADFSAVWAITPQAPFSQCVDTQGAALIWGEAIENSSAVRQDAARLRQAWRESETTLPAYDGFYSAVVYQHEAGLSVTADLLGLFPVYYYFGNQILLASSSPELIAHHPLFRKKFNPAGLIGLLLTNGLFEGQTLWQDVQRLAAGHALVWRQGKRPIEIEQYTIPFSNQYIDLPFSKVTEPLDAALRRAVARHAPRDGRCGLLLSGGLDSRMLGGYLRDNRNQVAALTNGLSTDIEMQCASQVASALGFEHQAITILPEQYPACAEKAAKWEHLAPGFSMITGWEEIADLRSLAPRVVAGLLGDAIVGGSHIDWAYSPSRKMMCFEAFFSHVNSWGINPQVLKAMCRREVFGDLVDHTLEQIQQTYTQGAEYEFQRAWHFDLRHRQRFHVGGFAWQISFGAWPVLPIIDREVLEVVAGLPTAAVAERRAQASLVCERFPQLARLPLDRSTTDNRPLQPRIRHQLAWHFKNKIEPLARSAQHLVGTPLERRYVYRIMDFNWAGWRTVRRHAEPYRERLFDLFTKDELKKILPPPDIDVHPDEMLSGSAGLKNLIGLMLFARDEPLSFA